MLLGLCNVMQRLGVNDSRFFRIAHVWAFGRDVDVHCDVLAFRVQQTIPPYVRKYLIHLQGEMT